MRSNKKSKLFSLAVLTSMLMPIATSCEPTLNNGSTSNSEIQDSTNLPESSYKDIDVIFNDATYVYDGQIKKLSVDASTLPEGVTVTYSNNEHSAVGSYSVIAHFTSDDNKTLYKDKQARLIIKAPADTTINWNTLISMKESNVEYDGEVHSLKVENEEIIPNGFAIKYENNDQVDAGTYVVTAIIYNVTTGKTHFKTDAVLRIRKKKFDIEAIRNSIRFNADSISIEGNETYYNFKYSPNVEHTLSIVSGLDSRLSAFYTNNKRTERGVNTVTIRFTSNDSNYEDPESITVNMRILVSEGFKLSFYYNQREILDSIQVTRGENCPLTADELITRVQRLDVAKGYTVSMDDANRSKLLNVTQDSNVYFTFTPKKYKVTYSLSNFVSNNNISEYTFGVVASPTNGYTLSAPVVNDGYYFEGWFLRPDYSEASRITTLGNIAEDITVYGHVVRNSVSALNFASQTFIYDGTSKTLQVEGNIASNINIEYKYYSLVKEDETSDDYTATLLDSAPSEIGIYKVVASFTDNVGVKYCNDMTAFLTITKDSYNAGLVFNETTFDWNSSYKVYPEVSNVPTGVNVKYRYYFYSSENNSNNTPTSTMIVYDESLSDDEVDATHKNTKPVEPGQYLVEAIFEVGERYDPLPSMFSYLTINKLSITLNKDRVFPDKTQGYVAGNEASITINENGIPTSNGVPLARLSHYDNNTLVSIGSVTATAYFEATDKAHYNDPEPLQAILTVNQNNSHTVRFFIVNSLDGSVSQLSYSLVADNGSASAPYVDKKGTTANGGLRFIDSFTDPDAIAFFTDDYFNSFSQVWFPCDVDGHIISTSSNLEKVTEDTNFVLTYIPKKYTVNFEVTNGRYLNAIHYVAYHPFYSAYYSNTDPSSKEEIVYNGFSLSEANLLQATPNENYEFLGWTDENTTISKDVVTTFLSEKSISGKQYLYVYGNHTLTADIRGVIHKVNFKAETYIDGANRYTDVAGTNNILVRYGSSYNPSSYDATDLAAIQTTYPNHTFGYTFPTTGSTVTYGTYNPGGDDNNLYTFSGYYDEQNNKVSVDMINKLAKEQQITIKFNVKQVTVTFLYLNGSNSNLTQTWNYNDTLGKNDGNSSVAGTVYLPANPTRTGYTFLGWTWVNGQSLIMTRNNGQLPTTTYDINNSIQSGSSNTATYIFGYNGNVAIPLSNDFAFKSINNVSYPDTVTLSAIWVKDQITVSYQKNTNSDPDSPTISGTNTVFNYNSTNTVNFSEQFLDAAPELTSPSYEFLGWYNGDTKITKDNVLDFVGVSNSIVLVSKWATSEYTITYILNNGESVNTSTQTVQYDRTFLLPDFKAPVGCEEYTVELIGQDGIKITNFIISNKQADIGRANNLVGQSFKALGINQSFIAILHWEGIAVGLSFVDNDGISLPVTEDGTIIDPRVGQFTKTYGQVYNPNGGTLTTLSLPTPYKKGYNFGGWFYGTVRVTDGTEISSTDESLPRIEINGVSYSNIVLKAQWVAKQYTINYSPNNGSNSESKPITFGETVFIPTMYNKVGYKLSGWQDDNGIIYTNDFTYTFDDDINLKAIWTAKTYKAQFLDAVGAFKVEMNVSYGQKYNEVLANYPYNTFFPTRTYNEGGTAYTTTAYTIDPSMPQFTLNSGSIINLNTYACNEDLEEGSIITLKAYGTPRTFTITFDPARNSDVDGLVPNPEGGANDVATVMTATYGEKFTPLSTPKREGFTFVSWQYKRVYSKEDNIYGDIGEDEALDFNSFNQMTDLIATAQWKAVPYKITFNYFNGANVTSELYTWADDSGVVRNDVYVGKQIALPKGTENYVPRHYKFLYWQDVNNLDSRYYGDEHFTLSKAENMTFKAVYEEEFEEEKNKLFVNLRFKDANGNVITERRNVYCGQQLSGFEPNAQFKYGNATFSADSGGYLTNPFTRYDDENNDRYGANGEGWIEITAAPIITDFTITNQDELTRPHTVNSSLTLNIVLQGTNVPDINTAIQEGTLTISVSDSTAIAVNRTTLTFNKAGEYTVTVTVNSLQLSFTVTVN